MAYVKDAARNHMRLILQQDGALIVLKKNDSIRSQLEPQNIVHLRIGKTWQDLLKTIVQDVDTRQLTKFGKKTGWKTLE